MALTFGTLLSSQGADAHPHDPFGAIGGNPSHFTLVGWPGSTYPAPPSFPLGRRTPITRRRVALGGRSTDSPCSVRCAGPPLRVSRPARHGWRASNTSNISQRCVHESNLGSKWLGARICWGCGQHDRPVCRDRSWDNAYEPDHESLRIE